MGPTQGVGGSGGSSGPKKTATFQEIGQQYLTQLDGLGKKVDANASPKDTKALRDGIKNTVKQSVDLQMNDLKTLKADLDKAAPADKPAKQAALTERANQYFGYLTGMASGLRARSYDRGMDAQTGRPRPQTDQVNPASDLTDAQKVAQKAADDIRATYLSQPKQVASAGWTKPVKGGAGWA